MNIYIYAYDRIVLTLWTRLRPPDWTSASITSSIARLVELILLRHLPLLIRRMAVSLVAMAHTTLYPPPLPPPPVPTEQLPHLPPPHIISTPSRSPSPRLYTIRMPHINSINISNIKRRIDQGLKDERRVMVSF